MMPRRISFELDDHTFQLLEAVAVGLNRNECKDKSYEDKQTHLYTIFSKGKNDFGPGVAKLMKDVSLLISAGVFRTGCWEHEVLISATGWEGNYLPDMLGPKAAKEEKEWEEFYALEDKQRKERNKNDNK